MIPYMLCRSPFPTEYDACRFVPFYSIQICFDELSIHTLQLKCNIINTELFVCTVVALCLLNMHVKIGASPTHKSHSAHSFELPMSLKCLFDTA